MEFAQQVGASPRLVVIEKVRHGQFFGVGGNMPLFSREAMSDADLGALLTRTRTAFDQAAVASVSASNPFPPLPSEYKGSEIRLQLAFSYNVPRAK